MKAIAVMKGGHIVSGELNVTGNGSSFNADTGFIKSFNDIENFKSSYKSFTTCSKLLGLLLTKKQISDYMKTLGVKELYFYDFLPDDCDSKEFKKYWFKYNNHLCSRCINKCKQSSRVVIVNCKEFRESK